MLRYKLSHALPAYVIPTNHANMPAATSSLPIGRRDSLVAAPVAARGPSVDVLVGDSAPTLVSAGANVEMAVGPFATTALVPLSPPSAGVPVPATGMGTCGVGNDDATTVCRPV